MKAVLIDDERNALDALRDILDMFQQVEIAAQYMNPLEALQELEAGSCDIIFLDIEMPGISGLEAAERLSGKVPDAEIVFVTAYGHYAVEAFELHALDYLLKPVRHARMAKTLERVQRLRHGHTKADEGGNVFVQSFGTFEVKLDQDGSKQVRWRTSKVRELFAYLVHHRGTRLHRMRIIEELMPGLAMDKALVYLHTCIYQIRKTIKELGLEREVTVTYGDQAYLMEWIGSGIYWDVDWLRQAAKETNLDEKAVVSRMEQAAALYSGGYLEHEDYPWSAEARSELLLVYNMLAEKLAAHYLHNDQHSRAVQLLNESIIRNPLHTAFHELLLTALARSGDQRAMERHYSEMNAMFLRELGCGPGLAMDHLYESLRD